MAKLKLARETLSKTESKQEKMYFDVLDSVIGSIDYAAERGEYSTSISLGNLNRRYADKLLSVLSDGGYKANDYLSGTCICLNIVWKAE